MRNKNNTSYNREKFTPREHTAPNRMVRIAALALAAALFFAATLTGCGAQEIDLLSAMMSAPPMTSYEYQGGAQIGLHFDIFEQEDDFYSYNMPNSYYKTIEKIINGAGIDITAKYSGDKSNTNGSVEMLMTPVYLGAKLEDLTMGVWAQVNLDDRDYLKEYFKLPKIITAGAMWDIMKGRDYLTLTANDFDLLFESSGIDMRELLDPARIETQVKASEKLSGVFKENIVRIAELINANSAYVQSVDTDSAGNSVYHVKITDEGLKSFIAALAKVDKAEMKAIVRLLLTASLDYLQEFDMQNMMDDGAALPSGLAAMENMVLPQYDVMFDTLYPEFVDALNSIVDKKQLVTLLGNNGISLDITVSRDGFIIGADGIIDLVIDMRGFTLANGERFTGTISKAHVTLTFQNRYTNVNKDVDVKMPYITNTNSLSFRRFLEAINVSNNRTYNYSSAIFALAPGLAAITAR